MRGAPAVFDAGEIANPPAPLVNQAGQPRVSRQSLDLPRALSTRPAAESWHITLEHTADTDQQWSARSADLWLCASPKELLLPARGYSVGLRTKRVRESTAGMAAEGDAVPNLKNLLPARGLEEPPPEAPLVGILALQGAFAEHANALKRLGARVREVRQNRDIDDDLAGLIIPGGESTTMAIVARDLGMESVLRDYVNGGRPVFGTCAGLIFLSNAVSSESQKLGGQALIGGLDVLVHRNFFGSQIDSAERAITLSEHVAKGEFETDHRHVFIRAPAILRAGPSTTVLATLGTSEEEAEVAEKGRQEVAGQGTAPSGEVIVAVQQGHILATAFHPELTDDLTWHSHFLAMVREGSRGARPAELPPKRQRK